MQLSDLELEILNSGMDVIGIDEAGRGAWAGPVAIGYYHLRHDEIIGAIPGVKDSKQLSAQRRADMAEILSAAGGVVFKSASEVDNLGIAVAIETAIMELMRRYHQAYFLIDGRFSAKFPANHKQIIKGDTKIYSIAAASILAKHLRDTELIKIDAKYPGYNFAGHKGYGTALHRQNLTQLGPCKEHRRSYKPVSLLT